MDEDEEPFPLPDRRQVLREYRRKQQPPGAPRAAPDAPPSSSSGTGVPSPWHKSVVVLVLVVLGSAIGAWLLVLAPESWVSAAVVMSIIGDLFAERLRLPRVQKVGMPVLALTSGATSGFSGTSGPLKGVAVRLLRLDRGHLVGAAFVVSLAGDAAKAGIYAEAGLLGVAP